MQAISLGEIVIAPEVLTYVTEPMANLYRICPIAFRDNTLTVAMCDPQNLAVLDELRNFLGYDIRAVVTTRARFKVALDRYFPAPRASSRSSTTSKATAISNAQLKAAIAKAPST